MSDRLLEILVFMLGGVAYAMIEILFRGHTHWSMVLTGGACVLTMYMLSGWLMTVPLLIGASACACIITFYELCVGLLVNVRLGWNVWDYSDMPYNVLGQICPTFTAIWFLLCLMILSIVKLFA